jgi:hypothetical protein
LAGDFLPYAAIRPDTRATSGLEALSDFITLSPCRSGAWQR